MSAMSDYLENALLGHLFKGVAYAAPANVYVGLSTAAGSDAAVGAEVAGGGYARAAIACAGASWTGPSGGNGTVANAAEVAFPVPSANWGSVTHWFVADAPTGGNVLFHAPLTAAKTINAGDAAPKFDVGALTIQIDD